jgi:hypothetical protein
MLDFVSPEAVHAARKIRLWRAVGLLLGLLTVCLVVVIFSALWADVPHLSDKRFLVYSFWLDLVACLAWMGKWESIRCPSCNQSFSVWRRQPLHEPITENSPNLMSYGTTCINCNKSLSAWRQIS